MIIDDTGMPERFIETDGSGVQSMRRLDDGWCEALNRNTFLCDQYLVRPTICRQFEIGGCRLSEHEDRRYRALDRRRACRLIFKPSLHFPNLISDALIQEISQLPLS